VRAFGGIDLENSRHLILIVMWRVAEDPPAIQSGSVKESHHDEREVRTH
jgi:hypothetical protein